ncbi:MAG: glycosyltransferase family 2 protein [Eubacteriaceae bacterium]|jgi:glycosyltransferase involved in cell wall biosynthesis|nr:glycosyltransferase family 2 protein [Eubacteriaceae bacterium]
MRKSIMYHIDSILKDPRENAVVVKGWAFDRKTKKTVCIDVQSHGTEVVEVKTSTTLRHDLTTNYNLPAEENVGFTAIVTVSEMKGRLIFSFKSDGAKTTKKVINLYRDYPLENEFAGGFVKQLYVLKRGLFYLRENGVKQTFKKVVQKFNPNNAKAYKKWIAQNEKIDEGKIHRAIKAFEKQPRFSILVPIYNVEPQWLEECIASIQSQYYPHWELCLADDCSTAEWIVPMLEKFAAEDQRIKVTYRAYNGHICEATNTALEMATGEYIVLLDNDDILPPFALYEVAKVINEKPDTDLIYSDEDKLTMKGVRVEPAFKPTWSPDLLMGTNYISHLGVYRTSIAKSIGGFRKGYEGAQDYDFVLRFTEKTKNIVRIPKVLYHWRKVPGSTADTQEAKHYAFEAGKKALQSALDRRGIKAKAEHGKALGLYNIRYDSDKKGKVSILIPTKDNPELLEKCVSSILTKTKYPNYEIVILDNGSVKSQTLKLFNALKQNSKIVVERVDIPFNFSTLNNIGVERTQGDYILLLNDDTEVINGEWLCNMESLCCQERVGAVGAKLLYEDRTIQHAGIIMGLGGIAGHGHIGMPAADLGYFGRLAIDVNYCAVTGACLLVKRKDYLAVGGLDESLTVAFNDVDFCLKLLEIGKDNVWVHNAQLFHYESKSRGKENTAAKQKRFDQESQEMMKRWKQYILEDPFYSPNLSLVAGQYQVKS